MPCETGTHSSSKKCMKDGDKENFIECFHDNTVNFPHNRLPLYSHIYIYIEWQINKIPPTSITKIQMNHLCLNLRPIDLEKGTQHILPLMSCISATYEYNPWKWI